MNLITVTNNTFAPCVFNLIESYKLNSCNEDIFIIYYDLKKEYIELFKKRYGLQVCLIPVEEECEHAFNSRFYFPKAYALKTANFINKPFMICDASHAFINKTYELEYLVEEKTRFFIEYPTEIFKNKYWATKKSLKLANCDSDFYKEAQSYWSGFHAYYPTDENKSMIQEQYELMLNPDIAGPSNLLQKPDGISETCMAHRNDQTVLSLMIQKYGFNQPFNIDLYNKFGDLQTAQAMLPSIYKMLDKNKICLYSRFSKHNNFKFIDEKLKKEIEKVYEMYNIDRNTGNILKE